jgi:hypothetical protein
MQVLVISLKAKVSEDILRVFLEALLFPAVDARKAHPTQLQRDGTINARAADNILNGRKYHHEISGIGGVGLFLSVRKALAQSQGPLLLLEDDCVPMAGLPDVCKALLQRGDKFDVAVHGPMKIDSSRQSDVHPDFSRLHGSFWGTHAVLYSSSGRTRAAEELQGRVDLQIDGKLSLLNRYSVVVGKEPLHVLVQTSGGPLAIQKVHGSDIQTGMCWVCDLLPSKGLHPFLYLWMKHMPPLGAIAAAVVLGGVAGVRLRP